jgi:hypothetical protein
MRRLTIILIAILSVGALGLVSGSSAHVKRSADEWYFEGVSRKGDDPKDPINFIYMPGSVDTSEYTRDRIETHMNDDWNTDLVGGRPWRKHDEISRWCKQDQNLTWLFGDEEDSDKSDFHGTTSRIKQVCGNQHHARFWDDYEHWKITNHGARHQWVVGGFHHEKVVLKYKWWCDCHLPSHKIDRDWDVARRELVRGMRKHCSRQAWDTHAGAVMSTEEGQGFENSGLIARLSLHHRDDGGCAGHIP